MAADIDIRVSPSLDAELFKGLDGYTDENAHFVADAVSAFNDAYVTIARIHDATEAGKRNQAWTEENRILIVGKEAMKHRDRLLRKMDFAARTLATNIAHTEEQLSKPLEARALGTLNAEIRACVKAMDGKERAKLLQEAMAGDDDTTLSSILAAPPFLSGMTSVDRDHYLHLYHSKKSPHLVERLTLLRGAAAKVDRDGRRVFVEIEKAVGAPANQVRGIEAANEAALKALRIEPA